MYGCPHKLHMGSLITATHVCGVCNGTGDVADDTWAAVNCQECGGSGVISQSVTLVELALAMRDALNVLSASPGKSCSWCHADNPTSVTTCPECGHDAQVPRLHCSCAKCRADRQAYDASLQQRTPDGKLLEDGHVMEETPCTDLEIEECGCFGYCKRLQPIKEETN